MNNAELCKWLRENSSGVYRHAFVAADRIEELEEKYSALKEAARPVVWAWKIHGYAEYPSDALIAALDTLAALVGEE